MGCSSRVWIWYIGRFQRKSPRSQSCCTDLYRKCEPASCILAASLNITYFYRDCGIWIVQDFAQDITRPYALTSQQLTGQYNASRRDDLCLAERGLSLSVNGSGNSSEKALTVKACFNTSCRVVTVESFCRKVRSYWRSLIRWRHLSPVCKNAYCWSTHLDSFLIGQEEYSSVRDHRQIPLGSTSMSMMSLVASGHSPRPPCS